MRYLPWLALGLVVGLLFLTQVSYTSLADGPEPAGEATTLLERRPQATLASADTSPSVPGEILVMFKPSTERYLVEAVNQQHGARVLSVMPGLSVYLMVVAEEEVGQVLEGYQASPYVQAAQRNYIRRSSLVPNDRFYANGQAVRSTADQNDFQRWYFGSTLLDAEGAWDLTTGRPDVIIAIIDSGIKLDHPDLAANIWVNPGEVPGDGIDNDGNGKVDDVNGWDFKPKGGGQDNDPNPDLGDGIDNDGDGVADDAAPHGTFVAGIAGAVGNNGVGIAGAAWNVKLMALKVSDDDGGATDARALAALAYAVSKGAHVANISLGGAEAAPCPISAPVVEAAITDAFNKGVLVVVAAGNENTSQSIVPASCTHALAVGSSDHNSTDALTRRRLPKAPAGRADFSNFGQFVDVVAPGVSLQSTSVFTQADQNAGLGTKGAPAVQRGDGTSGSAPLVSGLAALIISRGKDLGLNLTPAQVRALIENHAVNLPDDPDDSPNAGANWDGKGRVNFRASVSAIPAVSSQGVTTAEDTPVTITLTGTGAPAATLAFTVATQPTKGALGSIASTGAKTATVRYSPNKDLYGSDSFTFRASDGFLTTSPATVSITVVGNITTVAGGFLGDGSPAVNAGLAGPAGVAVDGAGNVFIADTWNHRIRRVAAATGVITTVAGTGSGGFSGDGGPATSAQLSAPYGVAVDPAGNVFIADRNNNRIRRVVAATGIITTVAGSGARGFSGDGGAATAADLDFPLGVAVDAAGNLFIVDQVNNRVRKVAAATGVITTVAGTGTAGFSGDGGPATSAQFNRPFGVAVDGAGNLFIAEQRNNRVRKVSAATGVITTVAGTGTAGFSGDGSSATAASLNRPQGVALDGAGNLFIADQHNNRVRKVAGATGVITTVAGTGTAGFSGDGGAATSAQLRQPSSVALDVAGNLLVADTGNNRIRKVAAATGIITSLSGRGEGDGGPATSGSLTTPTGVALDGAGNLFIADRNNHRVRKVAAATEVITTVAGTGTSGFSGDGGPSTTASLNVPSSAVVDAPGNLFIADNFNHRIRRVDGATGIITTVAGTGTAGFSGDGGAASSANLNQPSGVEVDAAGNLFIADTENHRVRKVAAATGVITTVAGTGTLGFSGDGGPATSANLNQPSGVEVDVAGNLFIADTENNLIRKVAAGTGVITTVAGIPPGGFSGDGGPATSASLAFPLGVALDTAGNLFIADAFNNRVRKVKGVAVQTTATRFKQTTLVLATVGASATVTVEAVAVDAGTDGVQLNIQHTKDVTITSPACVGIFTGASVIAPSAVIGGTSFGCFFLTGNVKGTMGEVITFVVTRVGTGNPLLTFGLGGGFGTQFSDAGTAISPGATNTLQIILGVPISGTVTLQGRTAVFPTGLGHGIAKVMLTPGGVTVSVNADGSFQFPSVAAGTFTLVASAPGYVSRQRTNVVVTASAVTVPPVQLRCGLVNNDNVVNINDITATVASFATSPTARVDAQGRFVDQNGDGVVNINDITCVVSGFGATSPLPWEQQLVQSSSPDIRSPQPFEGRAIPQEAVDKPP